MPSCSLSLCCIMFSDIILKQNFLSCLTLLLSFMFPHPYTLSCFLTFMLALLLSCFFTFMLALLFSCFLSFILSCFLTLLIYPQAFSLVFMLPHALVLSRSHCFTLKLLHVQVILRSCSRYLPFMFFSYAYFHALIRSCSLAFMCSNEHALKLKFTHMLF